MGKGRRSSARHLSQFRQVFLTSPHPPKEKHLSPTAFCQCRKSEPDLDFTTEMRNHREKIPIRLSVVLISVVNTRSQDVLKVAHAESKRLFVKRLTRAHEGELVDDFQR